MIVAHEQCHICGQDCDFVIADGAVLLREARCTVCGASLRTSDLAGVLLEQLQGGTDSFLIDAAVQDKLSQLTILNLCSSGSIHNALKGLDNYYCGEFFDGVKPGDFRDGVMCIDLTSMPFCDGCVDIVISEDVLEHVENVDKACRELHRVLSPKGKHYFTVPLHQGKLTVSRKNKRNIYHGDPIRNEGCLVYTDWGNDVDVLIDSYGFQTKVREIHRFYSEAEITDVEIGYDEYTSKRDKPEFYFKYNSVVICSEKSWTEISAEQEGSRDKTGENPLPPVIYKFYQCNKTIMLLNEKIKALDDEVVHRGEHILYLDKQLAEKNERIMQLQQEVEEKNLYITRLLADN